MGVFTKTIKTMRILNLILTLIVSNNYGLALPRTAYSGSRSVANMNGEYLLSNSNPNGKWDSDYSKFGEVEYMDVYSPEISTKYGEVFWTMMDPVPLDKDVIDKFSGKIMAVVGYETDQVIRSPDGDISVPIIHAYNHHYCAYMSGAMSEMKQVTGDLGISDHGMNNHGAPAWFQTVKREDVGDIAADSGIPTSQFYSEGNGGEFRKSYHGYPQGYAQLIESPTNFHIQPMQIDTKNRHYNGSDFRPDILPAASAAPENAVYSGLLECPCTDRIVKKIEHTFSTQTNGQCKTRVNNETMCYTAVESLANGKVTVNMTISDNTMVPGCSVIHFSNNTIAAVFNNITDVPNDEVDCGGGNIFEGSLNVDPSLTTVKVQLDSSKNQATITMSGPNGKYFSVGFNAPNFAMSDKPYTIVVDGTGNVSERKLGAHDPGSVIDQSISVTSNKVEDDVRTVVMTRDFAGKTSDHYTFDPSTSSIPIISASGLGSAFAYHGPKLRSGGTLKLSAIDVPTCVCDEGIKGSINGVPFNKNCLDEPKGDLVQQKNPTCWVDTYQGGLSCCHHKNILLDQHQTPPEELLTYQMKFRFYYQTYKPATQNSPASHKNLLRMYYQTEANAGEYDITKCPSGTPSEQCVQEITAHFKVSDMMQNCDIRTNPNCWGPNITDYTGIELIYAAGHCHAPSCISMELYHADTGRLLCSHYPVFGKTHEVMDELGYLAIPPCLWGQEEEGLLSPIYLPYDANLLSIKRNNNTYTHYGEMASWQMRGVLANKS